jgi:hypothetical protein
VGKFGRVKLRSCPFSSFELAQLALDTRDNRENYYLGNRSELCRDQGCDALFFFTLAIFEQEIFRSGHVILMASFWLDEGKSSRAIGVNFFRRWILCS